MRSFAVSQSGDAQVIARNFHTELRTRRSTAQKRADYEAMQAFAGEGVLLIAHSNQWIFEALFLTPFSFAPKEAWKQTMLCVFGGWANSK